MVNRKEVIARTKAHYRFSLQELQGLLIAILVTALIFSFRDWGTDTFDIAVGLSNLFITLMVVGFTFFFRLSCQKVYGVIEGHYTEFKVWWVGIGIAVVVAFISRGYLPLVLAGGIFTSLMIKFRLGEYRYGFSFWKNAVLASWGIMGNLILAILFAWGLYFFPESYLLNQGLKLNIIMAFCSLIPLPQMDGMHIFFGSRIYYVMVLAMVILTSVLLFSQTLAGIIIAMVLAGLLMGAYLLTSSEK